MFLFFQPSIYDAHISSRLQQFSTESKSYGFTKTSAIRLPIQLHHFPSIRENQAHLKVKCIVTMFHVYHRSNEVSIEISKQLPEATEIEEEEEDDWEAFANQSYYEDVRFRSIREEERNGTAATVNRSSLAVSISAVLFAIHFKMQGF